MSDMLELKFYARGSGDATTQAGLKVDREAGRIEGVSLMQEGEALGHDLVIDKKTLETAFTAIGSRGVKSFINHDWNHSPTEVAGLFSGVHIDGDKLRAKQFTALKSFKAHQAPAFDSLFELASDHADAFGVSLDTRGRAVWKLKDGSEVPAQMDWMSGKWTPPQGAETADKMPRFRVLEVRSADFVDTPAANRDGLFSDKRRQQPATPPQPVDAPATVTPTATPTQFSLMTKELLSAFGEKPELLTRAVKLSAEKPELSAGDIIAQINAATKEERFAALETSVTELTAKLADAQKAKADAEAQLSALTKERDELKARLSAAAKTGADPVKTDAPGASTQLSISEADRADLMKRYCAIKDPSERAAFYLKHLKPLEAPVPMHRA